MHTHMPFLRPDGIVYASAPEVSPGAPARWKLHIGHDMESARRLHTGLPEETIECSPTLAWFPEGLVLMFVGQIGGNYQFHRMVGPDLDRLSPAVPQAIFGRAGAHAGVVGPAFMALDRPEIASIEIAAFGQPAALFPYERFGLDEVARISFEYACPWRVLVSGRAADKWHTVVYDVKTGDVARILLFGGQGVYKASIDGDRLAYAERLSEAFEAREIRFASAGEWFLEPIEAVAAARTLMTISAQPVESEAIAISDSTRTRRERCLRANCATGKFCGVCRNHSDTRADLATLHIVDRDGNGCPRGLAWDIPAAALAAIRPGAETRPDVWCERFMIGTTPAKCQQCVAIRASGNADASTRWLQRLADQRRSFACASRVKTDTRRLQECCGREEKEIAVYRCTVKDCEVEPWDCRGCGDRTPPATDRGEGEATVC